MNILKLAALLLASSMAFAEVPQLINYQGQLTDAQGNPKKGPVNLSFSIYGGAEEGAGIVWAPQTFLNVPLINGSFNVILSKSDLNDKGDGLGPPISVAFSSADAYLQITDLGTLIEKASDDTEIKPRQQILSAPYAIHAKEADHAIKADNANTSDFATKSGDSVPIGTIVAWHKKLNPTLPTGWLEMNGQKVTDAQSPLNGKTLENLNSQVYAGGRGRYLRGGTTSGLMNESTYYTDNGSAYTASGGAWRGLAAGRLSELDSSTPSQLTYTEGYLGTGLRFQTAAMTVVWIIRIK